MSVSTIGFMAHLYELSFLCLTVFNFTLLYPFWLIPLNRLSPTIILLRKEVIQPHLLIRLPCYDFTPITNPAFGCVPLAVRLQTSGVIGSHGVTGGVYKTRERIHRGMLIRDY